MKKFVILSLLVLITLCSCSNQENAGQTSVAQTEEAKPTSTLPPTVKPAETNIPTEAIMPTVTKTPTETGDGCIDGSAWEKAIQDSLAKIIARDIELEFVDGSELDTGWDRIWTGKLEEDSPNTHEYAYNNLMDCVFLSSANSYISNQEFSDTADLQNGMIDAYGDYDVLVWNQARLNDCRSLEISGQNYATSYPQSNGQIWTFNCLLLDNGDYSIKLNVVY